MSFNDRYVFQHGADFEVKYIESRHTTKVLKDCFAVTGVGYKVYFEMMRLRPENDWQARKPRQWGFGDITDAITGRRVWNFREFVASAHAKQLGMYGFRGDMVTVCGDDNRTYVECRSRDGTLQHRFPLARLLPQWNAVERVPVAPLPVALTAVVVEVPGIPPSYLYNPSVPHQPAPTPAASKSLADAAVETDLCQLADQGNEMRMFVREVFSRMLRVPAGRGQ